MYSNFENVFNDSYPTIETYDKHEFSIHKKILYKYLGENSQLNKQIVKVPLGVESIAIDALPGFFRYRNSLGYVAIPQTVKYIGGLQVKYSNPKHFYYSDANYIVDEQNNYYYSNQYGMLIGKDGTLYRVPSDIEGNLTIPTDIKTIGYEAFQNCNKLTSVIIPDNVTNIIGTAFHCCHNITSIKVGNGITKLGQLYSKGFNDNISLLCDINLSNSITELIGTFADCCSLKNVVLPTGIEKIGADTFKNCEIREIDIPLNIKKISKDAFRDSVINKVFYKGTKFKWKKIYKYRGREFIGSSDFIAICENGIVKSKCPYSHDS